MTRTAGAPPAAPRARRRAAALAALAALVVLAVSPTTAASAPDVRDAIVTAARRQLGRPFRGYCSGFVLSLLAAAGLRVALPAARSRSESLYLASRRVEAPRPGDLAFFHDTYDRDRDGRANDPYTHVAVVEAVLGRVVLLLHRSGRGIERVRMDLSRPADPDANDPVRLPRASDPPGTRCLAGELFAGFGALAR